MNEFLTLVHNLDASILLFIQEHLRQEFLTPILTLITKLGDKGIFWLAVSVIMLIPKKTRGIGFLSIVAIAINYGICNLCLKNLVERIRPYESVEGLKLLVHRASDWSFPSGHASSSFAAAVVFYRCLKKKWLGVCALILAALIAFSRLYVAIHYPTDVIIGGAIGALVGFLVVQTLGRNIKKR